MFVLVILTLDVVGQTLHYKILWRGDSVGSMTVNRSDSAGHEVYYLESVASYWMFGEKRILTQIRSTFNEDQLIEASATIHRNETLRESSFTRWTGSAYEIQQDDKTWIVQHPIHHTIASAYFRIPVEEVYSERFGRMLPVTPGEDQVIVTKPNGYKNAYGYGTFCNWVEVDNTLVKLYIVRLSDTSQDISDPG